jgi:hypothetical protein
MTTDSVQPSESIQPPIPDGEALPSSLATDEMNSVAFGLWRRANRVGMIADECECCKGEAQQCYATCR